MGAMMLSLGGPALAQEVDGGNVDQQGGNVTAGSNSIVQQGQNFFNIQNQVAADVEQEQSVTQEAAITQVGVSGEGDVEQQAELNQDAQQSAAVGNVNVEDVHQSIAQAIAAS